MGNTVRREPVSFDIPDSPNYKFLNITNFRGLDISSNPFELATNTASDCLNVYVDETNTLTTRPRLEKKFEDFVASISFDKLINIYNISKGYLGQFVLNDSVFWEVYLSETQNWHIVTFKHDVYPDTFPKSSATVFEKGDFVYVLTSKDYIIIDLSHYIDIKFENFEANYVEGYIPTLYSVDASGNTFKVEDINLLSDKYRQIALWDGITNPLTGIDVKNVVSVENESFEQIEYSYLGAIDLSRVKFLNYYQDDSFVCYDESDTAMYYGELTATNEIVLHKLIDTYDNNTVYAFSKNNKRFVSKYLVSGYVTYSTIKTDGSVSSKIISTTTINYPIYISNNGKFIWYINDSQQVVLGELSENDVIWTNITVPENAMIQHISTDNVENSMAIVYTIDDYEYVKYIPDITATTNSKTSNFGTLTKNIKQSCLSNNILYLVEYDNVNDYIHKYTVATKVETPAVLTFNLNTINNIDLKNDVLYWTTNNHIIFADKDSPQENYDTYLTVRDLIYFEPQKTIVNKDDTFVTIKKWFKNNEHTIDIIKIISSENDFYNKWYILRKDLLRTTLCSRFDNNYWFANGNTYFRSQNNDPTYFPITEYNELGDSNKEITGFNLANDTTLIAYKENSLYLIQPFASSLDTREYTITESKNTVGNTAIDAPIVTTLTEIPLQINYDGIYGLSQLKNVSATERIADLMSEPINDRWLNEDDKIIKKTQTLNRLYWTYIILPDDEKNITKIYLLDNRTNSWYYWEIPIVVLNCFVKNNHAEFVDIDGNIYYLTTTDIQNKGFDTQLVTEYYDFDKKLIPWFWQSQILPLGTMNYSKRLVNTTFILTDTDTHDGYGLQYSFKVFRKLSSSVPEKELSGELTLVRSTTKKTNISKFGFIQMRISNITEESQGTEAEKAYRDNKLRLVGLGLKYVLLEGLIR